MKYTIVCRKCFGIWDMQVPIPREGTTAKFYCGACNAFLIQFHRHEGEESNTFQDTEGNKFNTEPEVTG